MEIEKLRRELQDQRTRVTIASLDEIEKFASTNPSAGDVRRFIKTKRQMLAEQGPPLDIPKAAAERYSAALIHIEESIYLSELIWEWPLALAIFWGDYVISVDAVERVAWGHISWLFQVLTSVFAVVLCFWMIKWLYRQRR